jgi:hypothetical protein
LSLVQRGSGDKEKGGRERPPQGRNNLNANELFAGRCAFGQSVGSDLATRHHGSDFCYDVGNAPPGIEIRVYRGMPFAIGVHDQDAGGGLRLLNHIWQMMAVVSGQGRAKNYQVEPAMIHSLDDSLAAYRHFHLMACFLNRRGLRD